MKNKRENEEPDSETLMEKMRQELPEGKDRKLIKKDIEKLLEDLTPEERLVLEKRFGAGKT